MQEISGWNTPERSIAGGINFLASNYVAVGQNTAYFQRFNVVNRNALFRNQYMQNIMAAQSEGQRMRNMYNNSGMLNTNLTFVIPVFENMPVNASPRPNAHAPVRTRQFDEARLNVNGTLTLRAGPRVDSILIHHINNGSRITVLERATTRSHDGMYWDKVIAYRGTIGHTGFMARGPANDPGRLWIQTHTHGSDTINRVGNAPNNAVREEGNYLIVEPQATLDSIRAAGYNITAATRNGYNAMGYQNIGTGTVLTANGRTFTVVKLGDLNGDGSVDVIDMILMRRHLTGTTRLQGVFYRAGRLASNQATIDVVDMILMQRHLTRTSLITI